MKCDSLAVIRVESPWVVSRCTCEQAGVSFQSEPVNDVCGRLMCDQLAVLGAVLSQVGTKKGNHRSLVLNAPPLP